jgi:hypothetical protein
VDSLKVDDDGRRQHEELPGNKEDGMIRNRKIMRLIEDFDGVIDEFEDVVASHPALAKKPLKAGVTLVSLLESATTVCTPINETINATLCLACDHFIRCHRDESGGIVVECWTHKRRERLARGTQSMPVPLNLD